MGVMCVEGRASSFGCHTKNDMAMIFVCKLIETIDKTLV